MNSGTGSRNRRHSCFGLQGGLLSVTFGLAAVTVALVASDSLVGPVLRSVFGTPEGFRSDYTSSGGFTQAMSSHCIALAIMFVALGVLMGLLERTNVVHAFLFAANPVTMALGYSLFRLITAGCSAEYVGLLGGLLVMLLGPLVSVPAMALGAQMAHMGFHRRERERTKMGFG